MSCSFLKIVLYHIAENKWILNSVKMIKKDNCSDANYLTISGSGQCPFSRVQRTTKWGGRQEVFIG